MAFGFSSEINWSRVLKMRDKIRRIGETALVTPQWETAAMFYDGWVINYYEFTQELVNDLMIGQKKKKNPSLLSFFLLNDLV